MKGINNVVSDFLSRNAKNEWIKEGQAIEALCAISDSREFWHEEQNEDEQIQQVKEFLKASEEEKLQAKQTIKNWAEGCELNDEGMLEKKIKINNRERLVLWAPRSARELIIETAHNSIEAGHGGNDRTTNRIKLGYWWPGITNDVDKYIERCMVCQVSKAKVPAPAPLKNMPIPEGPNHRLHVDLMGPLRTSENGNKYVMVMTDAFTKWVELAAIHDKTAKTIGQMVFERWICRFSAPMTIVTDQGKEFNNAILQEICKLWEIDKRRTSPFHPQTNSSAESYNRSLIKYFKAMLVDHSTLDWERLLPAAAMAYNCHVHRSTKESPFFLTYLHDPRLPYFDLQRPRKFTDDSFVHETYMISQKAFEQATNELEKAADTQKNYHDKRAKVREFKTGEVVRVYFPNVPKGENPKFYSKWQLGQIHKLVGKLNAVVKLDGTGRLTLVHLNRVRRVLHNFPPNSTDWEDEGERYADGPTKKNKKANGNTKEPKAPTWNFDDDREREREQVGRDLMISRELRNQGHLEDEKEEEEMGEESVYRKVRKVNKVNEGNQTDDTDSDSEGSFDTAEESNSETTNSPEREILGPWMQLAQGAFPRTAGPATRSKGPVPEQPLVPSRCLGWQPCSGRNKRASKK